MKTLLSILISTALVVCAAAAVTPPAYAQGTPPPGDGANRNSGDQKKDEEKEKDKEKKKAKEKAEKAAKERAKKAEKAAKEAKERAEKAAKEREKKAEKARKDAKERAEKAEKARREQAEKAAKEREKKAEKVRKDAKERAEKAEKARREQAEKAAKEQEERAARERRDRDERASKEREDREEKAEKERRDRKKARKDGDRKDAGRRDRDRDRDREARRRDRKKKETSARELVRTRVREGERAVIDGGSRFIERRNGRVVIRHDDSDRFRTGATRREVYYLPGGRQRIVLIRPDGVRIITIRERDGDIVLRLRRLPNGREYVLIDNRDHHHRGRRNVLRLDLGPLRITIPRNLYVVDGRRASRRDLELALTAPPIEPVERYYTLEEVRRFDRLRDKMRRVDLTSITFATDSDWIEEGEVDALAELASILNDIIARNPGEMFMIAGHTDLVGDDIYNLALSDRRAEAVAMTLTDYFGVPPENLVTQGYGEQFPVIPTQFAERANRRVSVQRITPLLWTSAR